MKKSIFYSILFLTYTAICQTSIDEYITIEFPSSPTLNDTILGGIRMKTLYVNNGIEGYAALKTKIDSKEDALTELPYDSKSLTKYYHAFLRGQKRRMVETGYLLKDSMEVVIDGFNGYKAIFQDAESKTINAEFIYLVLEEHSYNFSYISHFDFNEERKSSFFNSISIDKTQSPSQFIGNPPAFKIGYIFGKVVIYGGIIFGILWLIFRKKKE